MFKVACVVDKEGTALDRLSQGMKPFHDSFQFDVIAVHPKRPSSEQLARFEALAKEADVLDYMYYRTADMLRGHYPWLKDKPSLLTHNNPYSIRDRDWNDYDMVVANNQTIYDDLEKTTTSRLELIPLTANTDFWVFKREYSPKKQVLMVANRIEAKKGILPVAQACAELNIQMVLVGSISSADYFQEVMDTQAVKFYQQISDESLRQLYYDSVIHICNSVDDFESGTLPILEAMLCGTPVITRMIGHVPELYDKENLVINESDPEDVASLVKLIGGLLDDSERRRQMRDKAWQTAKSRSNERRAVMYQRLYRSLISDKPPVSVIVPIYDNLEVINKCLHAVAEQDYPNLELIVVNDNEDSEGYFKKIVGEFAQEAGFPVRYIHSGKNDYGLARARNLGIIYATGDILVFCDQRQIMEPDAVSQFVDWLEPRKWLYGNKGFYKEFVENFSCVYRQDIIDAGMFLERIDGYGGMSQEIRDRIRTQGIKTQYVEDAKATPLGKSSNRATKKQEIIRMKNLLWRIGRV